MDTSARAETPAVKESGKILPEVRGAACTLKTTQSLVLTRKRDLAFRLRNTAPNFTEKVAEPGLNGRTFKEEINFFVRYSLFSSNVRKNPEL
ncbi:hypothetical protein [Alkalicoccus halolimnae]|uniref:Uncharacterized protein n=1 Tax=Alkalicoccus halolimnae TaxID=1667239 RepID=A0A5C7F3H7_9BACI|nr:hypothetical protein [Alkalicoccus halolimnae]TXF82727.1 hypothetical protein FTX54_13940 [Alkalicoccus halolimnae]